MTYRGVYRDGVIVPESSLRLPEGTEVDFEVRSRKRPRTPKATKKKAPAKRPAAKRRMTKEERLASLMLGFGILKDDPSLKGKSTASVARALRKQALGGRFSGNADRR